MRYILLLFLLLAPCAARTGGVDYRPPFAGDLLLSANFGELRSGHFHGGLDFKTGGVEGWPVRAVADGWVERAAVSEGGYGNALYLRHADGRMSVYGHLRAFMSPVAAYVDSCQYARESYVVDLYPDSARFRVRQGEVIAESGNTGYSFGPHLHFEIRESDGNEPVDPMAFFGESLRDTRPPRVHAVAFYPVPGEGVVEGGTQLHAVRNASSGFCLPDTLEAWGRLGVGIRANDYMDGTRNVYGVRSVVLYVDSAEVFRSTADRFSFDENTCIDSWTDYAARCRKGAWVMKSFIEPGNPLRMLQANAGRGIVAINEERDYHFTYVLEDYHRNRSVCSFVLRGRRADIPAAAGAGSLLHYGEAHVVQAPGVELVVPRGSLFCDVALPVSGQVCADAVSLEYTVGNEPLAFRRDVQLSIAVRGHLSVDSSKYYIRKRVGRHYASVGGNYCEGWMSAEVRSGGVYSIGVDTVPPRLTAVPSSYPNTYIYKVEDEGSGVAFYRGTVDGKFVLVAYNAKDCLLTCRLDDRRLQSGHHEFRLVVSDACGNVVEVKKPILIN